MEIRTLEIRFTGERAPSSVAVFDALAVAFPGYKVDIFEHGSIVGSIGGPLQIQPDYDYGDE